MGCLAKDIKRRTKYAGRGTKSVFSALVRKAEKRKLSAENFHIYALLQSTIVRLKRETGFFETRKMQTKCEKRDYSACSSNNGELSSGVATTDILDLDEFFDILKGVGINR